MFWHNFYYSLKTLFGDRMLIFWTFAFPLILGTLFHFAFLAIGESEKLSIIPIGIVESTDANEDQIYRPALEALSDPSEQETLFSLTIGSEELLMQKLQDEEIVGFLKVQDRAPELVFAQDGVDQTIFKYTVEEITNTYRIVEDLAEQAVMQSKPKNPAAVQELYQKIAAQAASIEPNLRETTSGKLDYIMIEYYTLIAMTCLYGGMLGMVTINQKLANMSNVGKRVAVAPTKKTTVILSSALAAYVTQLIGLALLFAYTIIVLGVDYGSHSGLVVLLSLIGSLAGLAVGICITTLLKASENTKIGIIIAVTMFGCFLSGMMGVNMKYIVDKNCPILNLLNPANMITDGFYALYYYDSLHRFWFNIVCLTGFASTLLIVSGAALRRQKYDSI